MSSKSFGRSCCSEKSHEGEEAQGCARSFDREFHVEIGEDVGTRGVHRGKSTLQRDCGTGIHSCDIDEDTRT